MAKDTKNSKNGNLGSFVDAVTPEPKIILENYFNFKKLDEALKDASKEEAQWIQQLVDIVTTQCPLGGRRVLSARSAPWLLKEYLKHKILRLIIIIC
jgi:hypothetical protein